MPNVMDINLKYFLCTFSQETTSNCAPLKQESELNIFIQSANGQPHRATQLFYPYTPKTIPLFSPIFLISLMASAPMSSPSWKPKSSITLSFLKAHY